MKQEYLNEENYQQANTKLRNIAKLILIIGLLLGLSLITIGIMKSKSIDKENQNNANEIKENIEKTKKSNEEKIPQLETEIQNLSNKETTITQELQQLKQEQSKIFMEDKGFSDRYYAKETEISNKQTELTNIRKEISQKEQEKINSDYEINANSNDVVDTKIRIGQKTKMDCTGYYLIGGMVIFMSLMISGSIYLITKRRQIMAYQAQQVMPLAQEGMEKMAPTLGKTASTVIKEMAPAYKDAAQEMAPVYKDIAKEISKGIKEGLKDDSENK